jgi:flavin reductase (DIM6/NTAB) family NADH-FMN oxidoreductase RutF
MYSWWGVGLPLHVISGRAEIIVEAIGKPFHILFIFTAMLTINPKDVAIPVLQSYLTHAIAPRPIAFVSTIDKDGKVNLSPFSFFNSFSANPPILIFSPARSGRTNTTKHTHDNVVEVPEAVINMVSYEMVHQTSLSSIEYPKGVNEFIKAGFTMQPSEVVKPPRVKESPVQIECKVREVIELGKYAGSGNLVICEVLLIHVSELVMNDKNQIDQNKLNLVGRAGANWYVRAFGSSLFEVAKPIATQGIGVDALPEKIRNSRILTGNNLGQLGNVEKIPTHEEVQEYKTTFLKEVVSETQIHTLAKQLLEAGKVQEGWKTLLSI